MFVQMLDSMEKHFTRMKSFEIEVFQKTLMESKTIKSSCM